MANYDIRPLQLRILKNLLAVDKVCKEHNLRYYIMAGTMLGAVRHKGFIPWDDDLDIGMPRADYDLLMANAKEWLPEPYEAVCAENDKEYPLPFAKVQDANTTLIERMHLKYLGGVYIDIFPLDGVPESRMAQRMHFAKYGTLSYSSRSIQTWERSQFMDTAIMQKVFYPYRSTGKHQEGDEEIRFRPMRISLRL